MANVLVIDDDELVRFTACMVLGQDGHSVDTANDGREGVDMVRRNTYDLVVTDIIMPVMEGIETIQILQREYPALPIIAMSGGGPSGRIDYLERARALGIAGSIEKPFSQEDLCSAVKSAVNGG